MKILVTSSEIQEIGHGQNILGLLALTLCPGDSLVTSSGSRPAFDMRGFLVVRDVKNASKVLFFGNDAILGYLVLPYLR